MNVLEQIDNLINNNSLKVLNKEKIANYILAFNSSIDIFELMLKEKNLSLDVDFKKFFDALILYDRVANCVKVDMEHHKETENIDSHKIASIFLICLLKFDSILMVKKNQRTESSSIIKKTESTYENYPNIYFSYVFGIVLMESIYNIEIINKKSYEIDMKYGVDFVKLIYGNKSAILHPSGPCNNSVKGVFCLSHIFYFIEKTINKTDL